LHAIDYIYKLPFITVV